MEIHQPKVNVEQALTNSIRELNFKNLMQIKKMIEEREKEIADEQEAKLNIRTRIKIIVKEMNEIENLLLSLDSPEVDQWFADAYQFDVDFESLVLQWVNFLEGLE